MPWCLAIEGTQHTREASHQHHPKRSQGGKTIVAILCAYCHDRIDNRDWGNAVKEINGKRVYMIWDLHGEILYERDIGASTGEGESGRPGQESRGVSTALPSPVGASGVPSAAAEVPDSGSGADALAVAPGASREPEERVGRDSRGTELPAAVTPPDSLGYAHTELFTIEELRERTEWFEDPEDDRLPGEWVKQAVLRWLDWLGKEHT